MAGGGVLAAVAARLRRPGRLVGVDLARTLALLGMIATHVVAERADDGSITLAHEIAGGRASALFAVLAGVSLALVTGGPTPFEGRRLARARWGLLARAVMIGALGLWLGGLDTRIAVILPYYAVLFCLALPFLALPARTLAAMAGVWGVLAPVASQLLRPEMPQREFASPTLERLADPGPLLSDLLLTGWYPALPWLAYLLAGLALGRCDLSDRLLARRLVIGGAGLAVGAVLVSRMAIASLGVREALYPGRITTEAEMRDLLASTLPGSTPAGDGVSWWWLVVTSPHAGTPLDLLQTTGSALAVIGLCLLLVDVLPRARVGLVLLAGAGAAPLTCYAVHVVAMTPTVPPGEAGLGLQWALPVLVGTVLVLAGRRGPLETITGWPGRRLARRPVAEVTAAG